MTQLEAAQRRREKESQDGAKPTEPKAFMPTVKKAGGDTAAEITQAFMKSANAEKWNKLMYHYEDVKTSYLAVWRAEESKLTPSTGRCFIRSLRGAFIPGRHQGCPEAALQHV